MKKILSIALLVAFVATSVFAVSISGEASLGFNYKIDEKSFGFENNGKMNQIKFTFEDEFFNESKEVKGEGQLQVPRVGKQKAILISLFLPSGAMWQRLKKHTSQMTYGS